MVLTYVSETSTLLSLSSEPATESAKDSFITAEDASGGDAAAEEALRQSEERLQLATSAAQIGLHDFDVRTGTVQWDRRTREIWGVDAEEPITFELWRDSLHAADRDVAEAAVQQAVDPDGDGYYQAEYRVINRLDDQERWVLALGRTTFVDGVPVRLVGTVQEITERKRAEEELSESRERLRLALEAGRLGNWHLDLKTGVASTSLRHDQCFGATEPFEEWSYDIFMSYVHPDDRAEVQRRFDLAVVTRDGWHLECRVIWPDGSIHWIEAHGTMHFDAQNQPRSMLGVVQDITERKNTEEQLRRNHETFFHLVANTPFGVYIVDSEFCLRQISRGARKVFEQVRPLIGRDFAEVLRHIWEEPFASDAIARFRHTLRTGEPYVAIDTTERRHDIPEVESYDWRIERITLPDGQFGVVCYFYDLSEIKRAEAELRHRGRQLETLINQAPLGVYLIDADLHIAHVNPVARPVFGDVPDLIGRSFRELIDTIWGTQRGEEIMRIFTRTLETGESFHLPEFAEQRADRGITEYYDWRTDRIMLPDGRYGVVCYFNDISEQVRARETIARSEAKYRTLFESIDEGFAVIEMIFDGERPVDYRFVEINPAFERHTGLHDATGKTVRELVPNLEDLWFETYGRIARTGRPERFVDHARDLDERWFDVYAFRLGDGESNRVALLFKDITEQKRTMLQLEELNRTLEERVEARTREVRELAASLTMAEQEERRRIARVLHDGLQQLLFAVQFRLEGLLGQLGTADRELIVGEVEVARDWVSEAVRDARDLSLELSPPTLKSAGLAGALEWLAEQMREKHGLAIHLEFEDGLSIAGEDLRSLLFQCTRELLFNVVKHAGVHEARVAATRSDGHSIVVVSDEGAGFDAAGREKSSDGFGLAHMRQRVELIGGRMEVRSAPGEGTRVEISVPVTA
jgi:PAS domain S-box-containing protein